MANEKNTTLLALTTAAMSLFDAQANTMDESTFIDYTFLQYEEADIPEENLNEGASGSRYDSEIHQFMLRTPISNNTQLTISASKESMSGALPLYITSDVDGTLIQVMSGATIEEERNDANISFKTFTKNSDFTLSVGYVSENDFRSTYVNTGSSHTFNSRSSTIEWNIGLSEDYIEPTDPNFFITIPRPEKENKRSISGLFGFTQIINKNTIISSHFSYSYYDGFLSDPYTQAEVEGVRVADSRPSTKSQLAWKVAARRFINSANGALQTNYRYYSNNWGVESHTVDIGWHQNVGSYLKIKPAIRYYSQSEALFYAPFYTQARIDEFYSSDYRLSEFDALSFKLSISTTLDINTISTPFTLSYENYRSTGNNPGLINVDLISLSTGIKF